MSTRLITAVGLMSGTSLDGCDAAIVHTDGESEIEFGPTMCVPYSPATRTMVNRATKAALEGRKSAADIADAERQVTDAQVSIVQDLLAEASLSPDDVDVIGFHGQTILHRPPQDKTDRGFTWQLGDGRRMADATGISVVNQFRQADMETGGQGAPLAPIYHAALAQTAGLGDVPIAVLNIGGVANITFVPGNDPSDKIIAFDCGPGNGLIDQVMEMRTGEVMDHQGATAARGEVNPSALKLLTLNPFLKMPAPKSLDRYDFKLGPIEELSTEDAAATLTAFTAECVVRSIDLLPSSPTQWIVCGGGRHNPTMMAALQARMDVPVRPAEALGWRGDFIEAECFGYLAVRSLKKLPISFPTTTGAAVAMSGGVLHRASRHIS